MGERLREIVESIQASRGRLLDAISRLDQPALDRTPASGGWSVGEVLHHLLLMETSVTRLLERQVTRAVGRGAAQETSTASMLGSLDQFAVETAPDRIVAPQGFLPARGMGKQELLDGLAASRETLLRVTDRAGSIDLAQLLFPHPVLGRLNMYQWVLYIGQHELRHLHQIERTL